MFFRPYLVISVPNWRCLETRSLKRAVFMSAHLGTWNRKRRNGVSFVEFALSIRYPIEVQASQVPHAFRGCILVISIVGIRTEILDSVISECLVETVHEFGRRLFLEILLRRSENKSGLRDVGGVRGRTNHERVLRAFQCERGVEIRLAINSGLQV